MNSKKKRILIITLVLVLLIGIVGITYAVFSYSQTGLNQELVTGDIYMHYKESNTLDFSNALPQNTYTEGKYFEFTVDGKNTYTEKDIVYDIVLNYGDVPNDENRTIRIKDELLRFRLVEVVNNEEQEIFNNRSYINFNNTRIHKAIIPAETNSEITHRYRVYAWISNETVIGVGENVDYSQNDWNKVFASIKVSVTGDFEDKIVLKPLYDVVKTDAIDDSDIDGNGTPIHFYEVNGTDNGNGKFVRHNTLSDPNPIYYYRGNVDNNNVIFAGSCWKIVRTTETGGTKMIYNGEVSANKKVLSQTDYTNLNKTGDWTFDTSDNSWNVSMVTNVSSSSPYEISFNVPSGDGYILQITGVSTTTGGVSGGVFKGGSQVNGIGGGAGSLISLVHTYGTLTTNASDLIKVTYYVSGGNSTSESPSTLKIKMLQPDATLGYGCDNSRDNSQLPTKQAFNSSYRSPAYVGYNYGTTAYEYGSGYWTSGAKFGSSYTWNGTSYTLVDATETTPNATHHYSCNATNSDATCSDLRYVYYMSGSSKYHINLQNGKGVEDALKEMLSESRDTIKSPIHETINNWYNTNIKNSYGTYVEDTAWCNDRSVSTDNLGGWNASGGSLTSYMYFDVYKRYENPTGTNGIQTTNSPVLTCSNPNDVMSVANRKLENPVALLTYDEAALAGLIYYSTTNVNNYLTSGSLFWLLSPACVYFVNYYNRAAVGIVGSNGSLGNNYVNITDGGVRPVLSLKHGTLVYDGDGSALNPYIVGTPRT